MRDKLKSSVLFVVSILVCGAGLTAQTPVYQVVLSADPVALDVAVTGPKGVAAPDLAREDFIVLEDGEPQDIRDFRPVGMPYNILLLVDRSGRRQRSRWADFIIDSVDVFLKNLRAPDRLAVAAFDTRVAVLLDWRPSRNGYAQKILLRHSDQPTRFFEALDWASEEMELVSGVGRRGVIVFTDGQDMEMRPTLFEPGNVVVNTRYEVPASVEERFGNSLAQLESGNVPFYFVAMDTDRQLSADSAVTRFDGLMGYLAEVRRRVERLAAASGGRAVFPREVEDLYPLYERIHRDLGSGYHLTYTPKRPADGRVRRIEVRTRDGSLLVRQSRDRYLAR